MGCDEWQKCRLGDVLNFKRGYDLPHKDMVPGKYPVVGSNGIIGYHNQYTNDSPCVTIGRSGNIGKPRITRKKCWAHNTTLVIDNFKGNNPEFIYYFLQTVSLNRYGGGSAVPTLNRNHIHPIEIVFPKSIKLQESISKILSTLDKKIEINNKINQNLEEMAQAIFKHWFVDFEYPDENGNPYKSSGGEMVESELGMIPKGWKVYDLKTLSNMRNGVNYIRNQKGIPTKVINVRNFDGSLIVNQSKLDVVDLPQKQIEEYKLEKFDTVIVRSAKPGETMLNIEVNSNVVYSGFTIRVRTEENMKIYVFYYLRNSIKILNNSSNGTVFKNLNQKILGSLKVIVPSEDILILYNGIMKGYLKLLVEKNKEVSHLIKLRDTLLPKLMSGEIRVPTEQTVK